MALAGAVKARALSGIRRFLREHGLVHGKATKIKLSCGANGFVSLYFVVVPLSH